jgi:flagellar basal body-associated protein FliL
MAQNYGNPAPVKRSNTTLIIIIIVLLVLCCCCVVGGWAAWTYGDAVMESLGVYSALLPLVL